MPLTSDLDELLVGEDDPYAEENLPFGVVINLIEMGGDKVTVDLHTYGLDEEDAILVLLEAVDILRESLDGE